MRQLSALMDQTSRLAAGDGVGAPVTMDADGTRNVPVSALLTSTGTVDDLWPRLVEALRQG